MEDLLGSGQNFERWIKNGSVTRGNAAEEEDPPVARKYFSLQFKDYTCPMLCDVPAFAV